MFFVTVLFGGLLVYSQLSDNLAPGDITQKYMAVIYTFPAFTVVFFVVGLYLNLIGKGYKAGDKAAEKVTQKIFHINEDKNSRPCQGDVSRGGLGFKILLL